MAIHQEPIVIGPGTNTVTIPMPALYGLTVRVPAGNSSMNLSLNRRDIGESGTPVWRNAATNEDGVATFEGLPAGTYAITSHTAEGQKSMRVQVPSTGTVLFEPGTPKALAVRWKADDEYPASVGLQRDDVVVGIEGRDFDGTKSATVILQGTLMAKVECRLAVVRAGRRFEVTVDTAKFAKATQQGHLLEPIER
jgi:C-terminal processing protease CtpA/Prc